jgi:uncharacterized membrane protein YfcA
MRVDHHVVYLMGVALACFLTGLSKGGLGGTLGILITPMLALVMPLEQAIGLMLPILILADVFALAAHWRRWEGRLIGVLLVGGIIGVTLGTFVLTNISPVLLKRILGVIVLLFFLYKLFERRIVGLFQYQSRRWHGWLAGSAAGLTSTLAHAGGPPVTVYLLLQDVSPAVFVSTSLLFFAILNWIKVPYYFYAGMLDFQSLVGLLWLFPLVPLGVWLGKRLLAQVDHTLFERIILFLLLVTGMLLLVG